MREKKWDRIKQYRVWLGLLARRLWRQPAYIALLALIPALGFCAGIWEQDEPEGAVVAVCVEEGAWSGRLRDGLFTLSEDSILRFTFCSDAQEVERYVMRAEADCGFVIGADIDERVMDRDWRKIITVYETAASSVTGIAREQIGSVIFRLYSEQCYEDYIGGLAEKSAEGIPVENAESYAGEMTCFAKQAYEKHLVDGSTFSLRYIDGDRHGQYESDTYVRNDTAVLPVKGVFAVIIFISGMCGMLEYDSDRREKKFARIAPKWLTYVVDVWLPTVFTSAAVLLCLWISDAVRCFAGAQGIHEAGGIRTVWSAGMWAVQTGHLVWYQCVIVAYCGILGIVLKRQETIAAAIPILSIASLVCAPVFIRLAAYMPLFAVLEKLFPATYYLML